MAIPIKNEIHKMHIESIKELLELGTYVHDDKLLIYAHKTDTKTKNKFPLNPDWRLSKYLKAQPTPFFWNHITKELKHIGIMTDEELQSNDWFQKKNYQLDRRALVHCSQNDKIEILNRVRLDIYDNNIDIMLSGILTAKHNKSRLSLLAKTVEALIRAEIFRAKYSSDESCQTRSYQFINQYFKLSKYEIRFDTNRKQGLKLLKHCRKYMIATYNKIPDNTAYLTTPHTRSNDYELVTYDRHKRRKNNIDPSYFPIRLELRINGKLLNRYNQDDRLNDICKGNASDIISRFRNIVVVTISRAIRRVKAVQQFDQFCNKKSPSQFSVEENLNRLIATRTLEQQLLKLNERKKMFDEDEIDIPKFLKFHGHQIHRYGYDII